MVLPVIISGAFYGTNFGDQLFAHLLTAEAKPSLLKDACRDVVESTGVPSVSPAAIPRARGLVLGPGGYFGEGKSEPLLKRIMRYRYHYLPALLAMATRKKFAVIGVGVGPLHARFTKFLLRLILSRAEIVTVRDQESLAFAREYGVRRNDIRVGADAAIPWPRVLGLEMPVPSSETRIFLHVEAGGSGRMQALWREIIEGVSRIENAELVLGTDSKNAIHAEHYAWRYAQEILGTRASLAKYSDPVQFIELLGTCSGIVTHKLHVGIIGCTLGKSVVSFPIHIKTQRFYRQIGELHRVVPLENAGIDDWRRNFEENIDRPVTLPPEVAKSAEIHYQALNQFVTALL